MEFSQLSRRDLLSAVGVSIVGGLAGCSGDNTQPITTSKDTITPTDTTSQTSIQTTTKSRDQALEIEDLPAVDWNIEYDAPHTQMVEIQPEFTKYSANTNTLVTKLSVTVDTWILMMYLTFTYRDKSGQKLTSRNHMVEEQLRDDSTETYVVSDSFENYRSTKTIEITGKWG